MTVGPKPVEAPGDTFSLTRLACGWTVGRFAALDGLPGVRHVVTTRQGLDVNLPLADPPAAAQAVGEALGAAQAAWCRQVHGSDVAVVRKGGLAGPADALATDTPGLALTVRSADCPLILLADASGRAVGAAHASWRATVGRVSKKLVGAMSASFACRPGELVACLCPSAGPCCYQVGDDVRQAALRSLGDPADAFFLRRDGRMFFDLWAANADQLMRAGLAPANIHLSAVCTICRNDLFPSHRAEAGRAGRFVAAIKI